LPVKKQRTEKTHEIKHIIISHALQRSEIHANKERGERESAKRNRSEVTRKKMKILFLK